MPVHVHVGPCHTQDVSGAKMATYVKRVPSPAPGLHQDTRKAALPPPGNSFLVPAPHSSVWMKILFLVVPSRRNACLVVLSQDVPRVITSDNLNPVPVANTGTRKTHH